MQNNKNIDNTTHAESPFKIWKSIFKWIGIIILIIFSVYYFYITIPAIIIWFIWKKTKLTKKNKSIITALILLVPITIFFYWVFLVPIPVITISEPENNFSTLDKKIELKGTITPSDSDLIIVTENVCGITDIEEYPVTVNNGSFSYLLDLNKENNIFILKTTKWGKISESSIQINRIVAEQDKVNFTINSPESGLTVENSKIEIKGTVLSENTKIQIYNGFLDYKADIIDNNFSVSVPYLREGKNIICVKGINTESGIEKSENIIVNLYISPEKKIQIEAERKSREEQQKEDELNKKLEEYRQGKYDYEKKQQILEDIEELKREINYQN